jgi:hypothetical protein
MNLFLKINDDQTLFHPGEKLSGTADWRSEKEVRAIEVRLIWFTQGKGTQDTQIVDRRRWEAPALDTQEKFDFTLPEAPHSFSGKLITLTWAIELVVEKGNESRRVEFVLSPFDTEIELGVLEKNAS